MNRWFAQSFSFRGDTIVFYPNYLFCGSSLMISRVVFLQRFGKNVPVVGLCLPHDVEEPNRGEEHARGHGRLVLQNLEHHMHAAVGPKLSVNLPIALQKRKGRGVRPYQHTSRQRDGGNSVSDGILTRPTHCRMGASAMLWMLASSPISSPMARKTHQFSIVINCRKAWREESS